jgi:hypothetical protein
MNIGNSSKKFSIPQEFNFEFQPSRENKRSIMGRLQNRISNLTNKKSSARKTDTAKDSSAEMHSTTQPEGSIRNDERSEPSLQPPAAPVTNVAEAKADEGLVQAPREGGDSLQRSQQAAGGWHGCDIEVAIENFLDNIGTPAVMVLFRLIMPPARPTTSQNRRL